MATQKPWQNRWKFVESMKGGGQGETSVVTDNQNPTIRGVLKTLREEKESDPKARRRMFQEVSNLKVLHSARAKVPQVYDDNTSSFETGEQLYFVMEVIEGKTLAEVVAEQRLDVVTSIRVVEQLCDTLRCAVKEKIIHRDIKPENIIVRNLSPADIVMVDFGIARSESDSPNTEVGEAFDNKFISLPERRGPEENKRDPRSDLTGLCAILLYCLTKCVPRDLRDSSGRPPHRLNSYTLDKVVENEVQRALLNAFFDRGFTWELDSRFQTLDEIVSRLGEVLNPAATVPQEDLSSVAARESELLRKSDRASQIGDFRQQVYNMREKWDRNLQLITQKLAKTRFHVHQANNRPEIGDPKFGDHLEAYLMQMGVHNHTMHLIIAYHFCSTGEECSIVRKIDIGTFQHHGGVLFESAEQPCAIARYLGGTTIPFDLLERDCEATVARMTSYLRLVIEKASGQKPSA
jgi:serine/threonine protein kinase